MDCGSTDGKGVYGSEESSELLLVENTCAYVSICQHPLLQDIPDKKGLLAKALCTKATLWVGKRVLNSEPLID